MSNPSSSLSEEDVRQIAFLVETLEKSTFDFLQVELGDLKVTIGKGDQANLAPASSSFSGPTAVPSKPTAAVTAAQFAAPAPETVAKPDSIPEDGTVVIVAPIMGRFYAKPEPGAAAFVAVGSKVDQDGTIALIEVMKVFSAVRAGVSGIIIEIYVEDSQIVEFGQALFRVRPV